MKTLYFVGRSYPHRHILDRLKAMGYTLGIFADPAYPVKNRGVFSNVVELDFSSPDSFSMSLSSIPESIQIDGLLCMYENYIIYKVLLAKKFGLPSLTRNSAKACTDKYVMRSLFQKYAPAITPEYTQVESEDELLRFADIYGYPLVLKPAGLVKSLLVSTCYSRDELLRTYRDTVANITAIYQKQRVTDRKPRIVLERFIEGKMCSIAAFIDQSGTPHFCDGVVELTRATDIGYDDNFLYCRKLTNRIDPKLKGVLFQTAADGIKALGMTSSPAHVEIIYKDNTAKIVEIGARIGGYRPFMYEQSFGINMFEQEAKIATGETPVLSAAFDKYSAMYELFPKHEGSFDTIRQLTAEDSFTYFHQVAKKGDTVGCAKNGFRAAAIIGVAEQQYDLFVQKCQEIEAMEITIQ